MCWYWYCVGVVAVPRFIRLSTYWTVPVLRPAGLQLAAGSVEQRDEWLSLFRHFSDPVLRQGPPPQSDKILSPRVPGDVAGAAADMQSDGADVRLVPPLQIGRELPAGETRAPAARSHTSPDARNLDQCRHQHHSRIVLDTASMLRSAHGCLLHGVGAGCFACDAGVAASGLTISCDGARRLCM